MARNIFIVDAFQVNGEGVYSHISGYPKPFDSNDYNNDVDLALRRANGAFAGAWQTFCNTDNKQIQMVILYDILGNKLDHKLVGGFPAEEPET